jgi:hypothetical protein
MGRDQRFEHFAEAPGGAVRPEALNAEASALAQQEELIGKKLGIPQPCLAAKLDDPVTTMALAFLDHPSGRMIGVRQFDRRIGKGAAALARIELEFSQEA